MAHRFRMLKAKDGRFRRVCMDCKGGHGRQLSMVDVKKAPTRSAKRMRARRPGIARKYRVRVAADGRGFAVVRQGATVAGGYDSPASARGAMAKAINAENRSIEGASYGSRKQRARRPR